MASHLERLEQLVARLPESTRVDVARWGGMPTFRVGGKVFIFTSPTVDVVSVKLPLDEARAVVATDPDAEPTSHGIGRAGWVTVTLRERPSAARWREIEEWIRTSYCLVAPRRLASIVEAMGD